MAPARPYGHKPGCECVGCSPATRARGMAALKRARRKPNPWRKSRKLARRFLKRHIRSHLRKGFAPRRGAQVKKHMSNPLRLIGTNAELFNRNGRVTRGASLFAGPGPNNIILTQPRHIALGARIVRIDYDNRAKALRAYGRPGRFRHNFAAPVVVVGFNARRAILRGSKPLWKGE